MAAAVVSACSGSAGSERGPCLPGNTCGRGLVCLSQLCVQPLPTASASAPRCDSTATTAQTRLRERAQQAPPRPSTLASDHGRAVRFAVHPGAARLRLDDRPVEWFGATFRLEPGTHQVVVTMPDDARCCGALHGEVTVTPAPADAPHTAQVVALRLPLRPASMTLVGAPARGYAACDDGSVVRGDTPTNVPMDELVGTTRCHFVPLGSSTVVTVRPGRTTPILWPR